KQFIISSQFHIALACDDILVLFPSDSPFLFEMNFGPLFFAEHRPRKPRHAECEIVKTAQENIRANRSAFQNAQKMFRAFPRPAIPEWCQTTCLSSRAPSVPVSAPV